MSRRFLVRLFWGVVLVHPLPLAVAVWGWLHGGLAEDPMWSAVVVEALVMAVLGVRYLDVLMPEAQAVTSEPPPGVAWRHDGFEVELRGEPVPSDEIPGTAFLVAAPAGASAGVLALVADGIATGFSGQVFVTGLAAGLAIGFLWWMVAATATLVAHQLRARRRSHVVLHGRRLRIDGHDVVWTGEVPELPAGATHVDLGGRRVHGRAAHLAWLVGRLREIGPVELDGPVPESLQGLRRGASPQRETP
ncbi:MAG: hypothetical protein R3F61_33015 [Myxococcota bacterium]